MVEDGGAKLDNAGEYALEQYSKGTGAGWWSLGLINITAALKAVTAANEAHALSIDPHAVDLMLKKLTLMQDNLQAAAHDSALIASSTPLGGGYAAVIGQLNRDIGHDVTSRAVPQLVQVIDDLKAEIEKSRASYKNVDATQTDAMNTIRGRIQP